QTCALPISHHRQAGSHAGSGGPQSGTDSWRPSGRQPIVHAMPVTDIATRTYDPGWRLDPIVRSLLDTDFYKLLMLQMIHALYPSVNATFSVINRSRHIRLAAIVDEGELRAQLDHARTLRFSKKELIWLAGNTFYGKTQMFAPEFMAWLADFQLPDYELKKVDGQYELHFRGPWTHTTMWEIPRSEERRAGKA